MITFPNAKINLGLNITEKRRTDTTIWKLYLLHTSGGCP